MKKTMTIFAAILVFAAAAGAGAQPAQPGQPARYVRVTGEATATVDADLAITGISVVDAAETSGIGTKVIANEATTAGTGALDQFVGKSGAGSLVVKTNIDAVSGATVTTKGITKGANAALAAAEAMA